MIRYFRSVFCKHKFIHVKRNEYRDRTIDTYMCEKCGYVRKIKTM